MGLLYVASYLQQNTTGHDIRLIDCIGERQDYGDLTAILKDIKPDVVGITSFTISLIDVLKTARLVRQINPETHLCLGGHHPIAFPYQAAQLKEFDSIVVGEGEIAFTELVNAIEKRNSIDHIRGVYTSTSLERHHDSSFSDNRFLPGVNVPPAYIENIEELPIPNRAFIRRGQYYNPIGLTSKFTTMITSRGCPFHCTFCDMPYKKFRKRSVEKVIEEVKDCLSRGYEEIHFYDDLFNITDQWLVEFCDAVEKYQLKFKWDFRSRVNTVKKESLIRAKKAGCWCVGFGVETGTDEGLRMVRKGITISQIRQAFRFCREAGLRSIADFMLGFPFEKTENDVRRNFNFLIDLDPDYAVFQILMFLPNTEIYKDAISKGLTNHQKWIDFSLNPHPDFCIDYWTEHISREKLVHLQVEGYRKFYLRPKQIWRIACSTTSLHQFKRRFQGFLALWK
ncbi:MAG: B12-binding domain-containing radical SAM protein [Deltaproteobacteria bacterium]|nr:B12-binding domain-containing radical SAM protein [Deltaproteobacteria bacterium]